MVDDTWDDLITRLLDIFDEVESYLIQKYPTLHGAWLEFVRGGSLDDRLIGRILAVVLQSNQELAQAQSEDEADPSEPLRIKSTRFF